MGQGTGLGLSITYGIVREHEATIQCDSAPGQGTRFELRFVSRAADSTGRRRATASAAQVSRHATKRSSPRHRRRRNHAGHSRHAAGARRLQRAPGLVRPGRSRPRQVAAVRRRHRRRDDAGHRRAAGPRRAEEARRRAAGPDDHRLRVDGKRDRGDEEGRVRLHHQAVQERRSAGRPAERDRAPPAGRRERRRCARTCRRATTSSPASSARAAG